MMALFVLWTADVGAVRGHSRFGANARQRRSRLSTPLHERERVMPDKSRGPHHIRASEVVSRSAVNRFTVLASEPAGRLSQIGRARGGAHPRQEVGTRPGIRR